MYSSAVVHGSDLALRADLEPLLIKYKVDICIWGHIHSLERTAPVNNGTVVKPNFWTGRNNAPIHLVIGTGGRFLYPEFFDPQPSWSLFRDALFGYARFTFFRNSTFHYEFIANNGSAIIDEVSYLSLRTQNRATARRQTKLK